MDALQSAPPKSLQQLHSLLQAELRWVQAQLQALEQEFYGDRTDAYEFICRWAPVAREVMQCHSLTEVNSLRQIQSAIVLGRDPELRELQPNLKHIGPQTCALLSQLQNKLLTYVPSRFTAMADALGRVQSLCDKYLLSFYSLDSRQAAVDTAKKYTVNRRAWSGQVRDCLRNVLYNPHLFQRDGLRLARMHKATLDLLSRADILAAPFVGLFTDECEQMRAALSVLDEWIAFDQAYPGFIKTDLVELEKRRADLKSRLTSRRHELHTAQYRKKILQAEKAKLQVDVAALEDRESELLLAEEQLYQDVNGAKIDCEIKEFRREEIKRAARERQNGALVIDGVEFLNPDEVNLVLKGLKEQLRLLRHEIPQMERRMLSLRSKLDVIEDKHRRLREATEALQQCSSDSLRLKNEVSDLSYQLDACQKCLDTCDHIYKLKASFDTVDKIFHGVDMETRAVQAATTQKMLHTQQPQQQHHQQPQQQQQQQQLSSRIDKAAIYAAASTSVATVGPDGSPFDKMCLLVAQKIERDWKRLYRALPFVPQRGRETVDKDIDELQGNFIGESLFQCAWRALQRWRRFHRRAKLPELRGALERVRRGDLAAEIDAFLAPPAVAVVKETPLPANIDKDLVPFYRQVERYDNLVRQSREPVQ